MEHTFNPSVFGEAEAGRSLSSGLAWSAEVVPGQPGLHREAVGELGMDVLTKVLIYTWAANPLTHQASSPTPVNITMWALERWLSH